MATWKSNLPAAGVDSETMAMSLDQSNFNEVASPRQQYEAEAGGRSLLPDVVSSARNLRAWRARGSASDVQ